MQPKLYIIEQVSSVADSSQSVESNSTIGRYARNRRLEPRFGVGHKHLAMISDQDIVSLFDLSAKGFSVKLSQAAYDRLREGDSFRAKMRLNGRSIDIVAKATRKKSPNQVGFVFDKLSQSAHAAIDEVLFPLEIAAGMQVMESESLKSQDRLWLHGDTDTDLFVWFGEEIHAWQFVHEDTYVEWSLSSGLRTGQIFPPDDSLALGKSDLVLKRDEPISKKSLDFAREVVAALAPFNFQAEILITFQTTNIEGDG